MEQFSENEEGTATVCETCTEVVEKTLDYMGSGSKESVSTRTYIYNACNVTLYVSFDIIFKWVVVISLVGNARKTSFFFLLCFGTSTTPSNYVTCD